MLANNEFIIPIGLFDEHSVDISIESQIFVDNKPEYYALANNTKTMTGVEVLAMRTPKESEYRIHDFKANH
jgi:hypothetical protein